MAEFKISRLKFTYVGLWNTGNAYVVDQVITYSGKMYSCVVAHTASASFYTDVASKWQLIISGISWFGSWSSSTPYDIGNIVRYKNAVYICTLNHTSADAFDGTKFTTLSTFTTWNNTWTAGGSYNVGDIVKYGGIVYTCNTDHLSAAATLSFPVTNVVGDGNTVTVSFPQQTVTPYSLGQTVTIANASPTGYNGTYTVASTSTGQVTFTGFETQNFVPTAVSISGNPQLSLASGTVSLRFASAQLATDNFFNFVQGYKFIVLVNGTSNIYAITSIGMTRSSSNPSGTNIQDTLSFTVTRVIGSDTFTNATGNFSIDLPAGATISGSNAGDLSGLEQDQSKWNVLNVGIDFKGNYTNSYRYKLNDVVKDGPSLYICTTTHTSALQPVIDLTKFTMYVQGDDFAGVWDQAVAYQPGDTVVYGGYSYVGKTFNNVGNVPSVANSIYWDLFNQSFSWKNQWSNSTAYKVGSVVRQGAQLYVAIQDNTGSNPTTTSVATTYTSAGSSGTTLVVASTTGLALGMLVNGVGFSSGQTVVSVVDSVTLKISHAPDATPTNGATVTFIGQNLLYWKLVAPGTVWTSFWSDGQQYVIGDIVIRGNATYRCVQNHTAVLATNRPDLDTTNTYWIVYTLHARTNVLTNQGDIVTYNGTNKVALPINNNIGYAVKSTGTGVGYSKIFVTNNVFYVAPNGVDQTDYGTNWDQPWATIKYACNFVKNGTQNQQLRQVLDSNKDFLVAEMYNWMLYQKQQSTNGFTPASVFDATKTQRDAKLVIDALVYDLSRGGNSQTVAAALSYFQPGSTTVFFNTATASAMPYIIAGLNYISSILVGVANGTPPAVNYQGLMGVSGLSVKFQSFSNSSPDGALATALLTLITTALSAQSTASLPPANAGITVTINVKTGTYKEQLPITIPENTAINGDELRGAVIQPLNVVNTIVTSTLNTPNTFTAYDTTGMYVGCPIQFVSSNDTGATNLTLSAFEVSPGGRLTDATTLTGATGTSITAAGTYSFVSQKSTSGTGTGATFVIDKTGSLTTYGPTNTTITKVNVGSGYAVGDTITISGASLGGATPANDLTFTIGTTVTTAIDQGTTYYVAGTLTPTSFQVATTANGQPISLVGTFGLMQVFGGDALKDMFYMRNGSGLRNVTVTGLLGTLGPLNAQLTRRPTGKSFVSLDPGTGTADSSAWIKRKSPYVQNVTAFGIGCTGLKIDGSLHDGGNKSIVCNDYTHIISDGIGIWCTGTGGLCEAVSVFSYYGYAGYLSDAGGRIRATNGNSSYGTYGVVAEGYDINESATSGVVNNKYLQATATPGWVGGANNGVIKYTFSNAGQNYVTPVVNMLTYSNNFVNGAWTSDGNVTFSQSLISPSTYNDAWTLTATTSTTDASYVYQNLAIVPSNSFTLANQPYVLSLYVKQGTTSTVDLFAIFSGSSTRTSKITFNFSTKTVTPGNASGGFTPTSYGVETLDNSWYRIWFITYDNTALNTQLQYRVYPRGLAGTAGYVFAYGAQVQNAATKGFYLETIGSKIYSAYNNFDVRGNGTGVQVIGNEIRSKGIIETRVLTDANGYTGGANYLTSSNNAISGTTSTVQLANSETNLPTNYEGMRVVLTSGTGSGQYGVISRYNTGNNTCTVVKESFTPQLITAAANSTGKFTLDSTADVNLLRVNQPVQFVPQYFSTVASKASQGALTATATIGGQTNTMTVSSTTQLYVGIPITFSGTTFGGVITNYIYYVTQIVNANTIKISLNVGGSTLFLNAASGSMTINYPSRTNYLFGDTTGMTPNLPIQFTGSVIGGLSAGTIYYINDVIDSTNFTVSAGLLPTTATQTFVNKNITVGSSAGMILCNPIIFNGTTFGNIVAGTKYYINSIVDASTITVSDSLVATTTVLTTNSVITLASTTSMVVNNPIYFKGNPFGGLISDQLYYIKTISGNDITVSLTIGGTAISVSAATGYMTVRTTSVAKTLTATTGTMTVATTSVQLTLTSTLGSMNTVFQSALFGGVTKGTTYYILAITPGSPNTFTITATDGGVSAVALTTSTGSMLMSETGWDHVLPGTAIPSALNLTTTYYIEPVVTYSDPAFTQTAVTLPTQSGNYSVLSYGGGYFLGLASGSNVLARSADGTTWSSTTAPASSTWSSMAYGNGYWVLLASGSGTGYYSNSVTGVAADWKTMTLPTIYTTPDCAYGAGAFVVIDGAAGANRAGYSTTFGSTWTASTLPSTATWKSVCYGEGVFVAVATGGSVAAYSTDLGATWSSSTLPRSTTWSSVTFGNGRYVAVSSTSGTTAYSIDAVNWTASTYSIAAVKVAYGQGVFLAVNNTGTTAYTSEDGIVWKQRTVTGSAHTALTFGYTNSTADGLFITAAGTATGSKVSTGARAKGRAVISTGKIGYFTNWEAGSGYTTAPTITVFDPNQTTPVSTTVRTGNGVLGNPTSVNDGNGYITTSTYVIINGDGRADSYQVGLYLYLNSVTVLPSVGDNLTITGIDKVYKITSVEIRDGTSAPSYTLKVGISPSITNDIAVADGTAVTIRQKFSQVRLTNHDFLNIGFGDVLDSNYPGLPSYRTLNPNSQTVETNYGRVFYTSTDQDGNFKVGDLFGVQQSTGIVTISASQFGLTGLQALTLGGIAVGGSSVIVNQFSTDPTFVANSDNILPTQKAVKAYIFSRLSQGGSNTFTGNTIAGSVSVGGTNIITSTFDKGTVGSTISMPKTVRIQSPGGVDGNMMAQAFFTKSWWRR
jgi:hypothetical protein